MKLSDALPFALYTAVVVTLGLAMMGGPLWPLCVAGFLLLLYAVANEAPQPVRHDLSLPARTLGHVSDLDEYLRRVHERAAADGMFRDPNTHTRLGDV
jgi:hypothetical protein